MTEVVREFLIRYGMLDPNLDIRVLADRMKQEMDKSAQASSCGFQFLQVLRVVPFSVKFLDVADRAH